MSKVPIELGERIAWAVLWTWAGFVLAHIVAVPVPVYCWVA
jgi:flagellar motor component MotA